MKATYKEIKNIIANTPKELDEKSTVEVGAYEIIGYYHPSNANWSYKVGVITHEGRALVVVFLFGHIVAR